MNPWRQNIFRFWAMLPLAAALACWTGAARAKAASGAEEMKTYRAMMASHCRISQKKKDAGRTLFSRNFRLSAQWIRIRHVQKGWKGWVRVHAVCRVPGGTAWGYADLQLKSGEVKCESRNWDSMLTPSPTRDR